MKTVAVIGTGAIGSPMARCLIRAGFTTTVYDVRKEAMEPLVAMGAKKADRVADCAGSDVVLIVVANDSQVEDVVAGPDGLLSNLSAEVRPVIVVASTVTPKTVRQLGEQCRTKGLDIIDAPVSGGHVAAESGNLSVMVGGSKDTFEKMKPVLSAFGQRLYYVGELGAGEIVKLINNMVGVANMWLTVEALATGVRSGLSLDTLLSIMDASSGSNYYIRNWPTAKVFFSDFARDLDSAQNNLLLSIKDLGHAQELAELSDHPSPLLSGIIKALKELTPQYVVDQWATAMK
jgi:3-hydroxyisobutyrate dehydrogenase-like beta-hydroxyacid dehydrogenase